jgi:hypothetical protein
MLALITALVAAVVLVLLGAMEHQLLAVQAAQEQHRQFRDLQ